jgi:hypothetical protein
MATGTATYSTGELLALVLSVAAVIAIALAAVGSSWSVDQTARWRDSGLFDRCAAVLLRLVH